MINYILHVRENMHKHLEINTKSYYISINDKNLEYSVKAFLINVLHVTKELH